MAKARTNPLLHALDREASKPVAATRQQTKKAPTRMTKPSREGTHLIGGHFPLEVLTQLRILAAEENTTTKNLLAEALDDLFVKKGKARIAV